MRRSTSGRADPVNRRVLLAAVLLLLSAAAALGGSAALDWARIGFSVPLRGSVPARVSGSELVPVLDPLALLALAAVAAVLATGGWARRLLGALLLLVAGLPGWGTLRVTDRERLIQVAEAPARAVPDGTVTVFATGPALAAAGTVLLAAAGMLVLLRGQAMPRMGRRYRAPTSSPPAGSSTGHSSAGGPAAEHPTAEPTTGRPAAESATGRAAAEPAGGHSRSGELWERLDAGEDPTVWGDPR